MPHAILRVAVQDTGVGIAADQMDRLFQSFSQVDASTTRKYGGTGLGLAISKHLVERMGGQIGVQSDEGLGSTFWFTVKLALPASARETTMIPEAAAAVPRGGPLAAFPVPQKKARILLAEDNMTNQMVALAILQKAGYRADAVANGQEAVQALRTVPYDLILMDVLMPEMDGLEATRLIRDPRSGLPNPGVPIVAMTAHALKEDRERCFAIGMTDYVTKPVRPQELLGAIARQLETQPVCEPVPETAPAPRCPLDRAEVRGRLGADPVVFTRVATVFLQDTPNQLAKLQQCLAEANAEGVARQAHSLRGAAGVFGARELVSVADRMEHAGRHADLHLAAALLDSLKIEFARLRSAILDLLAQRPEEI